MKTPSFDKFLGKRKEPKQKLTPRELAEQFAVYSLDEFYKTALRVEKQWFIGAYLADVFETWEDRCEQETKR